jgi:indole-3-glycerol phosphate synthase
MSTKHLRKSDSSFLGEVSLAARKPNIFGRFEAFKHQEVAFAKQKVSPDAIREMARKAAFPSGFVNYLKMAREASGLPVLRKDFLCEPYQAYQSRAWGADCILIIMASVTDVEARELVNVAHHLGMDVLLEVHDMRELERAIPLGTRFIGINNRNLRTFEVTLERTEKLTPYLPQDRIVVCESGISSHADVTRLRNAGVRTFLVGESLMRQQDVMRATQSLIFGESLN